MLGGSKVSDKLGVIDNLIDKADKLLIGGGMVFTFLKAQGHEVGKSLLEADQLDTCTRYLREAEDRGVEILLPTDVVVDTAFPSGDREPEPRVVAAGEIPAGRPGPRHRPRLVGGLRGRPGRRPHGLLETGRWASSRSTRSPTAPAPSPRR